MKKLLLVLLFVPIVSFGQDYYVSAKGGLNVREAPYSKSKKERRDAFLQTLRDKGVSSKVRKSRGKDIDAACGQLANKIVKLQLDS